MDTPLIEIDECHVLFFMDIILAWNSSALLVLFSMTGLNGRSDDTGGDRKEYSI